MLLESHPTKSLNDFIKAIIETKSKEEEDRIIKQHLENLKKEIIQKNPSDAKSIEHAIKAIYADMLGQDSQFAAIFVIKLIGSQNIEVKKVGYLASQLLLEENSEFKILLAASIGRDLESDIDLIVISALNALPQLMYQGSAPGFIDQLSKLIEHKNPKIVQKSLIGLQRIEQLCPNSIPLYAEKIQKCFLNKSPIVVAAGINVIYQEIKKNEEIFKDIVGQLVDIQLQIIKKEMIYYTYQKIPAPYIQIKILKIIGQLCRGNKTQSELVYECLKLTLQRADNILTDVSYAVVHQTILTITKIFPKKELLDLVNTTIAKFLSNQTKQNLIYLGINQLKSLTEISSEYIQEHQFFVVSCLTSKDETIKRITLELLYKNTNSNNLEVIIEKFIESLKTTTDQNFKRDLCSKIFNLCVMYSPSPQWLMQKIDQLLEFSYDYFSDEMLNDLLNIYKEILEDDEEFGPLLVQQNMKYFQQGNLSNIIIKHLAWIITFAGLNIYKENEQIFNSLKEGLKILFYMNSSDWIAKCWILEGFQKVLEIQPGLQENIMSFLQEINSEEEEVKLKIFEIKNFQKNDKNFDFSDMDLEFNFLNDFIKNKKGKYFDNEIANQYLIVQQEQGTSLKFKNDDSQTQVFKVGGEKDELIVNEKKIMWQKNGLVEKEQKQQKIEKPKEVQKKPLELFDEMDVFKKPEKKQITEEELEAKKRKDLANKLASQMFQTAKKDDIFAEMEQQPQPQIEKKKKQEEKQIDFFEISQNEQIFEPYEISMEEYEQLWQNIDNQNEQNLKNKKLKENSNVEKMIQSLGFEIISVDNNDFISASICNKIVNKLRKFMLLQIVKIMSQ